LKTFLTVLLLVLSIDRSLAQTSKKDSALNAMQEEFKRFNHFPPEYKGSSLDSIGQRLRAGDKQAILQLAPYFDSKKTLTEHLGYHILQTGERGIARRFIDENCLFTSSELSIKPSTSAKDILVFYQLNKDKIVFSADAGAFLITPLTSRSVAFETRELTEKRKAELKEKSVDILYQLSLSEDEISEMVQKKDPKVLYKIAASLFRGRTRFDEYQSDAAAYIELLQLLTGIDIGVPDEKGKITYRIETTFEPDAKLNLLIYFAKSYQEYQWNSTSGTFYNKNNNTRAIGEEATLFQQLNDKVDSVAIKAFIKLTTCDTSKVIALADEYEKAEVFSNANYALPTFPYRFLKQLTRLTTYCKANNLNFNGPNSLRQDIATLKRDLPFAERHQLEDSLINNFTLRDITAFEYWCMIYEESSNLSYSAGRILDKFYSKNWEKIIGNKKQLDIYLKKALLFRNLAVSGIAYTYLKKFINSEPIVLDILNKNISTDNDITIETQQAIASIKPTAAEKYPKFNRGNYDTVITNIAEKLEAIKGGQYKDVFNRDGDVSKLFANVNYAQIGEALVLLDEYDFKWKGEKYTFMDRDFGFFNLDLNDLMVRKEFLLYYRQHSQNEVYRWYLDKMGIDYCNKNGSLNYDKIYDILKYDAVTAFVGGGGGWVMDNEVYAVIKLLELQFNTTLGFPNKLCNSANSNGCNSFERASQWMAYLKEKHLLKRLHDEPVSYNFVE
jgi:hypothetical protein